MKFVKQLRRALSCLLLRGWLRNWWVQKRANQLENAYLQAITTCKPPTSKTNIILPDVTRSASKSLKRILFIGDCMWEESQLFPEIRKICQLEVLNLNPFLAGAIDPKIAVVSALSTCDAGRNATEPDLILFYLRPSLLSEEAFSIIRRKWSCPLLGMNLDDRVEFFPYGLLASGNDGYCRWARHFDLNLTSSLTAFDWYKAQGAEATYLPQGFHPDPRFIAPPDKATFKHPFSFVGSWKPERSKLIDNLSHFGIQTEIYGSGWPSGHWVEDPAVVFRCSQINLGIGYALASARIANAKGRDIECPATGACYLTTYHWELAELFEIGKEVLCYRNVEELIELHSYYSQRPEACLAIAQAAHRRAHREHTWESRLRRMLSELGFNPSTP